MSEANWSGQSVNEYEEAWSNYIFVIVRRAKEIMVKLSEPLNSRVHFERHVQCTVHHLSMSRFEGLILSRIVNRHMELQTNEGKGNGQV